MKTVHHIWLKDAWEEDKHPRAEGGKFASAPSGKQAKKTGMDPSSILNKEDRQTVHGTPAAHEWLTKHGGEVPAAKIRSHVPKLKLEELDKLKALSAKLSGKS
jgi:hypothetical protein